MSRPPRAPLPKGPIEFPREVWSLFDQYVHGDIDRRGFLAKVGRFAVGGWTAATILEALNPRFAEAAEVAADDPRIARSFIEFASREGYGRGRGLLAVPKTASAKRPGVLVIHENRGLNPHIEDIALRLALAGYVAFAPDALFPLGGYPGDEDKARALFATLDQTKTTEDFIAALGVLEKRPECNGTVGAVGFCYGGGMANTLAVRVPSVAAAVPFYGGQPKTEDVPKIRAAIQCHYAEMDDRINAGIPAFAAALKAHGIQHQIHTYPGTQHGFNNNTTPRYHKAAATLAWSRTLDFFKQHLGA